MAAEPDSSAISLNRTEDLEREPFVLEPDTPLAVEDMGFDEQFDKPEGRPGDVIAQWAAYVRAVPHLLIVTR